MKKDHKEFTAFGKGRIVRYHFRGYLLVLFCVCAFFPSVYSQNIKMSGIVLDKDNKPIAGASVMVKGMEMGISTDDNGSFTIAANIGSTLTVHALGYVNKEIKVESTVPLKIVLESVITNMEEVIVVGYGTQRKKDVTGSVVSVNEQALRDVPTANLQGALQGRAAGLEVQKSSSRPGAGAVIRIRGERSINGSNDPLLVLDGIPYEGGNINDINPDDVASVEILKDASATAIYGSRGSNGVLLITTKKGKNGPARVSYNGYVGINTVAKKYPVFNVEQYQALRDVSTWTAGYMPEEAAAMAAGHSTNWQNEMYENGMVTDNNLTVSGGANGSTYSLGGGFYKEKTVLPGQEFRRGSIRATIDTKIGNYIKIGLNTMNNITITNGSQFVNPMYPLLSLSPLMTPYDSSGNMVLSPTGNTDDRVSQYNPLLLKQNNNNWVDRIRRLRTFNTAYAEVQLAKGLKYRLNAGLDYRLQENDQFQSSDVAANPSYFRPKRGNTASVNNYEGWGYTLENVLTYDKTIKKHRFNITALYSYQEDHTHNTYVSKDSIDENFIQFYNLGQASSSNSVKPITSGGESSFALISYMARINYCFDDRFLLTATGRVDGSSRLAPGHKFHSYPAFSAGWNLINEKFMSHMRAVSALKLRVGYGQTSNQSINPYTSLGQVSTANNITSAGVKYNYGPTVVSGYNLNELPNANLDWEYTQTVNLGLDFGFINNRITGNIDYYNAKTSKILYGIVLPSTSGILNSYLTNIGKMSNHGLEFSLSSTNISSSSGFNWNTDLNLFFNRNKLLELTSGFSQNIASQLFIGQPLSAIYDYKKIGIWQTNEAEEAAKYGNMPGDIKLADLNGDGIIDPNNDRSVIGNSQAKWQGGLTNRFSYKGFDLSFVAYARIGGLLISQVHQPMAAYLTNLDGKRNGLLVDYWTSTNPTNEFPSPNSLSRTRPVGTDWTTLGYYSASFVRIRSINLGYRVEPEILQKMNIQSFRLYVSVQNPFVLYSPYMRAGGVDPEANGTGNQGISDPGNLSSRALTIGLNTPPTRSFSIGLNVSF